MNGGTPQRSSIFSGLLLILVGLLLLLERFHPDLGIGHLLRYYWPVLLILWGLAKLIDYILAQREGGPHGPFLTGGEAGLVVLVVAVLATMSIAQWLPGKLADLHLDNLHFDHVDKNKFREQASRSVDLPARTIPAGARIAVATGRGDITIHEADGNELRVSASASAGGDNQDQAQERLKSVNVVIEPLAGGGFAVHPVNDTDDSMRLGVDLEVQIPAQSPVTATTNHGVVQISGVNGNVGVNSGAGDVDVHDCGGDVTATVNSGDTRITDIKGSVRLNGHGDSVEVGDVTGDATIAGGFSGEVQARNVGGTTQFSSAQTTATLAHLTGRLQFDAGDLQIADVGGAAQVATRNKDVDVENVGGALEVSDVHGNIVVRFARAPTQAVAISNESGGVDLTLPDDTKFQIAATSSSGEVDSDFDDSTLQLNNDNGTGRLTGTVGGGGPRITIVTTYGTIALHKSS
ncbi:MAG: DUF4097 family beta strand repeat-containing protein [Candidatus Acidiferrales bacterium]